MANETVFNHRAEHYAKARPGYAPEVWVLFFRLVPAGKAADMGSGTGIFAGPLMDRGLDVFCVEPNAEMRAQAVAKFAGNPHFFPVAAPAEDTGLPERSVDAVTAASALHWFDAAAFSRECRRILKPGGVLFFTINAREYDPFTQRQHALCAELCPGFTSLRHGLEKMLPMAETILGEGMNRASFDFPLTYSKENFLRRSLSSSYAPDPGTVQYEEYVKRLRALLEEFAPGADTITVPNKSTGLWR